jgi:hypothetical protein
LEKQFEIPVFEKVFIKKFSNSFILKIDFRSSSWNSMLQYSIEIFHSLIDSFDQFHHTLVAPHSDSSEILFCALHSLYFKFLLLTNQHYDAIHYSLP